jgi:LPXTG-motif cell wall-anchored protein
VIVQPAPALVVIGLALVGLAGWLVIARRRRMSREVALNGWAQATCPVCLVLGSLNSLEGRSMSPPAVAVR